MNPFASHQRITFWSCLEKGKFPSECKKANVVPALKNNNMLESKSYPSISLLPFSGRIFERLLYDSLFNSFTENSLISKNQLAINQGTLILTSSCLLHIKSTSVLMAANKLDLYS